MTHLVTNIAPASKPRALDFRTNGSDTIRLAARYLQLVPNSVLSMDDLQMLGAERLIELVSKLSTVNETRTPTKQLAAPSEFAGYSINSTSDEVLRLFTQSRADAYNTLPD